MRCAPSPGRLGRTLDRAVIPSAKRTGQRRRALAHQCSACRRHWALQVVDHPAGVVVRCRYCGAARRVNTQLPSQAFGS